MRFLADENFPYPALAALRDRGYDVASIAETHPGSSDEIVAAICDFDERILLTFDKDFGELVFRRGLASGSSVVLLRIEPDPAVVANVIHFAYRDGNSQRGSVLRCGARPSACPTATNDSVNWQAVDGKVTKHNPAYINQLVCQVDNEPRHV